MSHVDVRRELDAQADPARAAALSRFFKTGPGGYGEGDSFLGIPVPVQRAIAKRHAGIPLSDIERLLQTGVHEYRLTALLMLVAQYAKGDPAHRRRIFDLYLANTRSIDNWDLVDASAEHILGAEVEHGDTGTLVRMARSADLWERRMAMVACFHSIKRHDPRPALEIATLLERDPEDLVQKAVGWMLREVGRRCGEQILEAWLLEHRRYATLPRTTLRSAIERIDPERRQAYLTGSLA